jgi:hypothetical protein
MESYLLAWLVAARHTSIDCFEKRGVKGFLFTVGDEWTHPRVDFDSLKDILGYTEPADFTAEQLLAEAQRMYHVFHLHINETGYHNSSAILNPWKKLLGERLLIVEDHNSLAEIIASTVAMVNGVDLKTIVDKFDPMIAKQVTTALANVTVAPLVSNKGGGSVVKL